MTSSSVGSGRGGRPLVGVAYGWDPSPDRSRRLAAAYVAALKAAGCERVLLDCSLPSRLALAQLSGCDGLLLAGGLDVPDGGHVRVEGNELTLMSDRQRTLFRCRRMGIIFQAYNLLPTLTAAENIAVPLLVDGVSLRDVEERHTRA